MLNLLAQFLTNLTAVSVSKKTGISSQNVKVTKKSTGSKTKSVAAEPLKKTEVVEEAESAEDDFEEFESLSEGSEAEDAYLEGFESSEEEEEEEAKVEDEFDAETGFSKDTEKSAKQKEVLAQAKARAAEIKETTNGSSTSDNKSNPKGRGVLYIGRIPHGFYEDQMKAYFGQFGTITRLRLSRNKKTGKSKHYAFIEFESGDVAKVVADTMDNYLLFGHILKVKLMAEDQVRDDLFVGSNRKYKAIPWNEVNHQKSHEPKTRKYWEDLQAKNKERRAQTQERLKSMGINYSYESPVAVESKPAKKTSGPVIKSPKLSSKKKASKKT